MISGSELAAKALIGLSCLISGRNALPRTWLGTVTALNATNASISLLTGFLTCPHLLIVVPGGSACASGEGAFVGVCLGAPSGATSGISSGALVSGCCILVGVLVFAGGLTINGVKETINGVKETVGSLFSCKGAC